MSQRDLTPVTHGRIIPLLVSALAFHAVTMMLTHFADVGWLMTVDYVILALTALTAVAYIAKKQLPVRFQAAQVLLVLFMVWYLVSCISMSIAYGKDWVAYNHFPMMNTAVCMFLAFPLGYVMIREKKNTFAGILFHILLLTWTIFISFVLIRVFQGQKISLPNGGIIRMKLGLELNCHYNETGAFEMLAFLAGCFLALWCRKLPFRIIYGLSSVIHYIALTLSNSRTSVISTLAGFAALAGIAVYLQLKKHKKPHPVLFSLLAAVVAGAAFYLLSGLVFRLYNVLTSSTAAARSTISEVAENTTFTGRTRIWKAAIEGVFSDFRMAVFGVTPMSVSDMINQIIQDPYETYAHTHNEFLQVLAATGVPGLCLFLGWFFLMLKDSWKLYFSQKNKTLFLFIPAMILAMMLANKMEAFLVFGYEVMGFSFFLLCGILHGKTNDPIPAGKPSRLPVINRLKASMSQST